MCDMITTYATPVELYSMKLYNKHVHGHMTLFCEASKTMHQLCASAWEKGPYLSTYRIIGNVMHTTISSNLQRYTRL